MELSCNKTLTSLIVMALTGAVGVLLLFLGCAIHFPGDSGALGVNWWAIFVLIIYIISPIPLAIARRCVSAEVISSESGNLLFEICYFLSACIVVAGFGFPVVLARKGVIQIASAGLVAGANIFVFGTVYSFFAVFGREDEWDWSNNF